LALIHACFNSDKILFLGFGGGFIIPFLKHFKSKIILNFGGLDWKRDKWSPKIQKIIKKAERNLVTNSSIVIADNVGIQHYIKGEYDINAPLVAYGGDQASFKPITPNFLVSYPFLRKQYACAVTRIQKDNNVEMILEAFKESANIPLVIIGNWDGSDYGKSMKTVYGNNDNIIMLDAIYDKNILDVLRSNCTVYIHGHSAGGTNPSLCEAMYLGLPVIAFASGYNEYATESAAIYFKNKADLITIINDIESYYLEDIKNKLQSIAHKRYIWRNIAMQYKEIILK
jgi:glycosyltransferase involved in cell wall biosynthesis